jgi:hypothetical protein
VLLLSDKFMLTVDIALGVPAPHVGPPPLNFAIFDFDNWEDIDFFQRPLMEPADDAPPLGDEALQPAEDLDENASNDGDDNGDDDKGTDEANDTVVIPDAPILDKFEHNILVILKVDGATDSHVRLFSAAANNTTKNADDDLIVNAARMKTIWLTHLSARRDDTRSLDQHI